LLGHTLFFAIKSRSSLGHKPGQELMHLILNCQK
jgi:hypothetical protein